MKKEICFQCACEFPTEKETNKFCCSECQADWQATSEKKIKEAENRVSAWKEMTKFLVNNGVTLVNCTYLTSSAIDIVLKLEKNGEQLCNLVVTRTGEGLKTKYNVDVKKDNKFMKDKICVVNLTTHEVVVVTETETRKFPASGKQARVTEVNRSCATIDGIPSVEKTYGNLEGLPEPQPYTWYIVSVLVLQVAKAQGRNDCCCPDTGTDSVIRDASGKIVGVKRFQI